MNKSKFLKICCPRCRKEQVIFGRASTKVRCIKCKILLAKTQGGKAKIKAEIKEVL